MTQDIITNGYFTDDYIQKVRNYRSLIKKLTESASPDAGHVDRLKAAVKNSGATHASLMTEDWCGDSACNVPILSKLFEGAGLPFRIIRGSEVTNVKEFYENDGATHIPVVSIWDDDENELARWIEAPEAVARRKDAWKKEHPEFEELYEKQKSGDTEAMKKFGALYRQFLEEMAGWYRDENQWSETTREIVEGLEQSAR
ncbi:MAG: thioredoxin family protein [Spirochaetota bacterium]